MDAFLATAPGSEAWRQRASRLWQALAEPIDRAALAAAVPASRLDRMAERLGMAEAVFPVEAVRQVAALIEAAMPGALPQGWERRATEAILAGMSEPTVRPPGPAAQLESLLREIAEAGGTGFAQLVHVLAEGAKVSGGLPPAAAVAVRTLARETPPPEGIVAQEERSAADMEAPSEQDVSALPMADRVVGGECYSGSGTSPIADAA